MQLAILWPFLPPEAPPRGDTTFGGFGAAAIETGSRGRATTVLVGTFTASSLLSSTSTFPVATVITAFPATTAAAAAFPAAITAAAFAGERSMDSMASVAPFLPVS